MCDVTSIAVFCSESIECFPGTVSTIIIIIIIIIIIMSRDTNLQVYKHFMPQLKAVIVLELGLCSDMIWS